MVCCCVVRGFFLTVMFVRLVLFLVFSAAMSVAVSAPATLASQAYLELQEPKPDREAGNGLLDAYRQAPSDEALKEVVLHLIRRRQSEQAWDLIEGHGAQPTQAYFDAKLATINARMSQVSKLKKLGWARQLKSTCTARAEKAPKDASALECLAKFHSRAPGIAGGDDEAGAEALARLIALNPARGYLVEAEITFPDDADKALTLVNKALSYDAVYDEGLMQAAMVYGYFKDWDAAAAALARVDPSSPVAAMTHYQLGKLSAQLGERLAQGEAALLRFLQGDTLYYGVDFRGPAHWRLGQIFRHGERYDLAKLAFERALTYTPRLSAAKKDLKDVKKRIKQRGS